MARCGSKSSNQGRVMQPPLTQPPDPSPKKPLTPCSSGAIDTHIHFFGPASQYPFHPNSRYTSQDALPSDYANLQKAIGLHSAVIVSGGGYGTSFTHLANTLKAYPGQFKGVALLPEDVTDEDLQMLDQLGVCGARFVSHGHQGALPRISTTVAARIANLGWHINFYPAGNDLLTYGPMLQALPNHAIVLDHFAAVPAKGGIDQPAFQQLLQLLDTGRFWVKLSGPMRCSTGDYPYADITPLARMLVAHAPQRLIWGSDWPHVNMNNRSMPNDGDLFDLLSEWVPDAKTRDMILVHNPRALYGEF